jgi:hypothetical protein
MEISEYSERGMVYSLFYQKKYAEDSYILLDAYISLIDFPKYNRDFSATKGNLS